MDCNSEDMIGMLAGMNCKVEEREVVGGQPWENPGSFPLPSILTMLFREALAFRTKFFM